MKLLLNDDFVQLCEYVVSAQLLSDYTSFTFALNAHFKTVYKHDSFNIITEIMAQERYDIV